MACNARFITIPTGSLCLLPAMLLSTTGVIVAEPTGPASQATSARHKPAPSREASDPADCSRLISDARRAKAPEDRIRNFLNAARCILVRECAAPLSNELCWTSEPSAELGEIVARGRQCLDQAEMELKKPASAVSEAARREFEDRLEMLRSFAALFDALARVDVDSAKSKNELIDACVRVSTYLDDSNPGIAQSAKLWQAVAYRRAGRTDRSLQLLLPAVAGPLPFRVDLFARIERCRALADRGQFIAAQALSMKIANRLEDWVNADDEATRKAAQDTMRWVRALVGRQWAEALEKRGQRQRAAAAGRDAAAQIGDEPFPPARKRWLRLDETISGLDELKPSSPAATNPSQDGA